MRRRSFLGILWSSFTSIHGVLINIIGVALGYIAWVASPTNSISIAIALPVLILSISLILTFGNAAFLTFQNSKNYLPKVLMGRKSPVNKDSRLLCLLEPSELFSYDSYVSFYYAEDKFERFLGHGYVVNIQDDGHIQVELVGTADGNEEVIERLAQNDKTVLEKIRIKPTVTRFLLERGA